MVLLIGLLILGFVFLYFGAESFVRGGVVVSKHLRIPEYVVGATIVSIGTSLPEALTSFYAALHRVPQISVSNIVGSNVFNIAVVLGLASVISPVVIQRDVFSRDAPPFLMAAIVAIILGLDGTYSRWDGLLLLVLLVAFVWFLLRERELPHGGFGESPLPSLWMGIGFLIIGPILLIVGSRLTVRSAVEIAQLLGVSQWIIGVTIVALGTSLPEVFTSVVASIRGNNAIALGNVMGSNVFNLYFILGGAAVLSPLPVQKTTLFFDLPSMFLFHLILVFMIYDRRVTRESGLSLLIAYVAFVLGVLAIH